MEFYIGQTFAGVHPPAAAGWCNTHNAHLERIGNQVTIVANLLPGTEELLAAYKNAVREHLDSIARSRGYDNTYICLSYFSSTDPVWHKEANAFNVWRDQVWRRCHEVLDSVTAGTIPPPSVDELLAMLPAIDWNYVQP